MTVIVIISIPLCIYAGRAEVNTESKRQNVSVSRSTRPSATSTENITNFAHDDAVVGIAWSTPRLVGCTARNRIRRGRRSRGGDRSHCGCFDRWYYVRRRLPRWHDFHNIGLWAKSWKHRWRRFWAAQITTVRGVQRSCANVGAHDRIDVTCTSNYAVYVSVVVA